MWAVIQELRGQLELLLQETGQSRGMSSGVEAHSVGEIRGVWPGLEGRTDDMVAGHRQGSFADGVPWPPGGSQVCSVGMRHPPVFNILQELEFQMTGVGTWVCETSPPWHERGFDAAATSDKNCYRGERKTLKAMFDAKVTEPTQSEWLSTPVLVRKKTELGSTAFISEA